MEIKSIPILNADNNCYCRKIQEKVKNEDNIQNIKQYSEIVYKKKAFMYKFMYRDSKMPISMDCLQHMRIPALEASRFSQPHMRQSHD